MTNEFSLNGRVFHLSAPENCLRADLRAVSQEGDLAIYEIECEFGGEAPAQNISLTWSEPMLGIQSTLTQTTRRSRQVNQWFAPTQVDSNFYKGAPILSVVDGGDKNFATVALSDAVLESSIQYCVNDFADKEQVDFVVTFLRDARRLTRYSAFVRIDRRAVSVVKSVRETALWWRSFYPALRETPDGAMQPLYSSWYNYHQHPNAESLLKELPIAAEMGFKTLIIDDGWQYDGNGTGDYFDCGNWEVCKNKFADMRAFVARAHELGIQVMLWFPMPFIGQNTAAYEQFKGYYLEDEGFGRAAILDPRYPSVRNYLTELYCRFLREYDLDGLKLDFIDSFRQTERTPAFRAPMDCANVEEGVIRLCDEIDAAMHAVRPQALIEFRQNYIGPAIVRYGNMLRIGDCAFDSICNRTAIGDLRMFGYDTAIHSDMLYWHHLESPENCAMQLLNVLFSVPQISVLLQNSTAEQKAVLKNFISYWSANRSVLLRGEFDAKHCEAFYSEMSAVGEGKRIQVNYVGNSFAHDGLKTDLFNASGKDCVYLENASAAPVCVKVYDCFGTLYSQQEIAPGVSRIDTPAAALVCIG